MTVSLFKKPCWQKFEKHFGIGSGSARGGDLPIDDAVGPGGGAGDLDVKIFKGAVPGLKRGMQRDMAGAWPGETTDENVVHFHAAVTGGSTGDGERILC